MSDNIGVDASLAIDLRRQSMAARHPNKHIREAIRYAEKQGGTFTKSRGHIFGQLRCGGGCRRSVYSTPKSPENHAKRIRRAVDRRPHGER